MAYLKIYSKTEIDTDSFIPHLRFDYKRTGSDSDYYPDPTYEYFYDDDSELNGDDFTDKEYDKAYQIFCDNLHWIYGRLDAMKIDYKYNIESGEWRDESHPKYKEGYESAMANFC